MALVKVGTTALRGPDGNFFRPYSCMLLYRIRKYSRQV